MIQQLSFCHTQNTPVILSYCSKQGSRGPVASTIPIQLPFDASNEPGSPMVVKTLVDSSKTWLLTPKSPDYLPSTLHFLLFIHILRWSRRQSSTFYSSFSFQWLLVCSYSWSPNSRKLFMHVLTCPPCLPSASKHQQILRVHWLHSKMTSPLEIKTNS